VGRGAAPGHFDLDAGQQSGSPEVSPMNIVKDPIGAGKFLVQNQVPS
jgi:hypothetical protein